MLVVAKSLERVNEVEDLVVDHGVGVHSPHVVQVVIVGHVDNLRVLRQVGLQELEVVSSHQGIILPNEEQNVDIIQSCGELAHVVERSALLAVLSLVPVLAVVELLELPRPYHLEPVHGVLGGSASHVVSGHHGQLP